MGDDTLTMLRRFEPQCDGICRPPEAGSAAQPTAPFEHFLGGDAEGGETSGGSVTVIEMRTSHAWHGVPGRRRSRYTSCPAPLIWKNFVLSLEEDLAVVDAAREIHGAEGASINCSRSRLLKSASWSWLVVVVSMWLDISLSAG